MDMDNDYNIAARYRATRKHLDSLGYRQSLSLDALPLIEKLLSDLIQTTDSLKHFKAVAHDNIEACEKLQLSIDPYKCDNSRLVQECNRLHLDLIEVKETHQKQIKDLKRKVYNLESECNDLQAASSRNLKRIKDLELESAHKSKRILELFGRCNKPLINNVALGNKKRTCYPLRRPAVEAHPLPKSGNNYSLPSHRNIEPQVVDLVVMADRKINSLNIEVTGLKEELSLHVDSICTLKAQLDTKEKEISRLRKMLEGGRPYCAISKDCSCSNKMGLCCDYSVSEKESNLHSVCHKSRGSDELQTLRKAKSDLEEQLREALGKQHEAMFQAMRLAERNEQLEKELRDIDHIALAVEADCNSTVKENNKRVSQLQEKLESILTQVHVLEGELMVERRSAQELRADLEGARLENRNLQRKLESSLDEKKQMNDRINQLTIAEQSLNEDIERVVKLNGNLKQEVARLYGVNNLLKKQIISNEIDRSVKKDAKKIYEKVEKKDKNRGKTDKKPVSRGQRRVCSPPVHEKQTEATRRLSDTRDDEVTRDSNIGETRKLQRFGSDKDVKINQLQQTIDQVQADRDFYKKEYNRFREQSVKNTEVDNAELWGQVCELRRQLIDKEHEIVDLQKEKKELCREKFELEMRLRSTRVERRNVGHCSIRPMDSCACSSHSALAAGDSKASSGLVERLERERDVARADVDRLMEERDTLRERLKLAVGAHKFEQQRLKESLYDVETKLKTFEQERQDLLVVQGTQRSAIDGFEDQLEDLREELRRTKQELSMQRTQYFQLRTLQDQADQALGDVQGQLNHSQGELYKAMERNRLLEQQKQQLDEEVNNLKREMKTMRAGKSVVDQEKDQLLMDIEEKGARIVYLECEVKVKEQELSRAEQQLQEQQNKIQLCVDQSAEQERRIRNMQMEMEMHQRQLASASTDRDNAAQENRRLQDDLAAVTCEIRTLQRELEVSRSESFDLKRQLKTYVSEVRRAEELLNKKENERTEMLNNFRSLSQEATMLENNNHSLESEAAEARGALQAAQDRTRDLERQLVDQDCLIKGYETQISELTQTVAGLETQIRQQMDQRQRAEADLNAVRDLCVKLDQQKESLVKELGDKDAMKAQYEAQLARLKAEQNMVQDQINRDHVTVERLESLLDQARQESMDSQTANQELQCEITRLKQRACEMQNKLSSESAELRRYQNQAAEYSKQIAELRRQVTNERFDRARKEEEHRRYRQSGNSAYLHELRLEAQRTNRFDTYLRSKGSPITTGKCWESNSKMYSDEKSGGAEMDDRVINAKLNSDSKEGKTIKRRGENPKDVKLVHCGGICIETILVEDDKYKDIRVRISSANFDGQKNRAGVKFCTTTSLPVCPKICQETQVTGEKIAPGATREVPSEILAETAAPRIGEMAEENNPGDSTRIGEQTYINSIQLKGENAEASTLVTKNNNTQSTQFRNAVEENQERRPTHSRKMDKAPQILHSTKSNNDKNNDPPVELLDSERVGEESIDDDTSGYHTSGSQKRPNSNDFYLNDERTCSMEGSLETEANATLRMLENLLRRSPRIEERRSRSVPRRKSNRDEELRTNFSGPIYIDQNQLSLTDQYPTRPEFIRKLTDIKENTANVERKLARINSATRKKSLNGGFNGSPKHLKRFVFYDENIKKCDAGGKNVTTNTSEEIVDKERGVMNKKHSDGTTRRDFLDFETIVTCTPKGSKKIGTGLMDLQENTDEGIKEPEKMIGKKSKLSKGRHDPSKNKVYAVESEEPSETQTGAAGDPPSSLVLVDENTIYSGSKIHKAKRPTSRKERAVSARMEASPSTIHVDRMNSSLFTAHERRIKVSPVRAHTAKVEGSSKSTTRTARIENSTLGTHPSRGHTAKMYVSPGKTQTARMEALPPNRSHTVRRESSQTRIPMRNREISQHGIATNRADRIESPSLRSARKSYIPTRKKSPEKLKSSSKKDPPSQLLNRLGVDVPSTSDDSEYYFRIHQQHHDRHPDREDPRRAKPRSRSQSLNRTSSPEDLMVYYPVYDTLYASRTFPSKLTESKGTKDSLKPFAHQDQYIDDKPRRIDPFGEFFDVTSS